MEVVVPCPACGLWYYSSEHLTLALASDTVESADPDVAL